MQVTHGELLEDATAPVLQEQLVAEPVRVPEPHDVHWPLLQTVLSAQVDVEAQVVPAGPRPQRARPPLR